MRAELKPKKGKRAVGQLMIEKILEVLQSQAELTVHLLDIFTSDYHSSYRKLRSHRGPIPFKTDWAESYREAQRFYAFMNKLKRQGFIAREKQGKTSLWRITKEGREKWRAIKERSEKIIPAYTGEDDGVLRIVAFDVPERERAKRTWLQAALKSLEFTLLQKSVWRGTVRIPKVFFEDLRKKGMLAYVHIFEAGKRRTLEELDGA